MPSSQNNPIWLYLCFIDQYGLSIFHRWNALLWQARSILCIWHITFWPSLCCPTLYPSLCLLDLAWESHLPKMPLPIFSVCKSTFPLISIFWSLSLTSILSLFHRTCVLSSRFFSYIYLCMSVLLTSLYAPWDGLGNLSTKFSSRPIIGIN